MELFHQPGDWESFGRPHQFWIMLALCGIGEMVVLFIPFPCDAKATSAITRNSSFPGKTSSLHLHSELSGDSFFHSFDPLIPHSRSAFFSVTGHNFRSFVFGQLFVGRNRGESQQTITIGNGNAIPLSEGYVKFVSLLVVFCLVMFYHW